MRFGGLTAVNNVNLEIRRGEIRAIIGPNGAGKSTFFNCVTGAPRTGARGWPPAGAPPRWSAGGRPAGVGAAEPGAPFQRGRETAKTLTTLIAEHDMPLVMHPPARTPVFHNGAVLAEGPPAEIQ